MSSVDELADLRGGELDNVLTARAVDRAVGDNSALRLLVTMCAIPRRFDSETIEMLTELLDDDPGDLSYQILTSLPFCKAHQSGGYAFHEVARGVLRAGLLSET